MTTRIATVLSVREWEPALVAAARDSASVRIMVRAFQPSDIDQYIEDVDVVVVGGDTAWVTPAHVRGWRSAGVAVIGVVPAGDRPAEDLLVTGGADEVVPDSIAVDALVQAIRFVAPHAPPPSTNGTGRRIAVVGARGAPGCTEVAVAYASAVAVDTSCVLLDLDVDAPSVAVRLGLDPRPDLEDVIDSVHDDGSIDPSCVHHVGKLAVVTGPHRGAGGEHRLSHLEGVVRASALRWHTVVADLGASTISRPMLEQVDEAILVVDASALGIVRAARLVDEWMGPAPALVLNRVDPASRQQTIEATRKWTGLDPAVVVADRRAVRRAACSARAPDRRFARTVGQLGRAS